MSAIPATNVLANVYQLYKVEYQCALMLMIQSQGITAATVNAYHTIYKEAQTVFLKTNFFPSSKLIGWSSDFRLICRIFNPMTLHKPIAAIVQVIKKPWLRNPFFPLRAASLATLVLSSHSYIMDL